MTRRCTQQSVHPHCSRQIPRRRVSRSSKAPTHGLFPQRASVELTSAQKQLKRKMVAWYAINCVRDAPRRASRAGLNVERGLNRTIAKRKEFGSRHGVVSAARKKTCRIIQ